MTDSDIIIEELIECPESPDPMTVGPAPHRIDYTNRKTVVVIDKDHFCLCKRLVIEEAPDEDFASLLNIPEEKVRVFKHKMQIFEDRLRGRRRAARLNARRMKRKTKRLPTDQANDLKKKEMSSEERYKCARDLILQNYTTREISKVLKISIRSVTRFRKRLRETKKEMLESGELEAENPDEEWEFRNLSQDLKGKKIAELLDQNLPATEIAKILKINERSVRRWRVRIEQMKKNPEKFTAAKSYHLFPRAYYPHRRYRKCVDRPTAENIRKLLESGATNKEICVRLGIPMQIVMKVVQRIWTNTIEGIIDDTPEKIKEVEKKKRVERDEEEIDEEELVKKKKKKRKVKKEDERNFDDDDDNWDPHGLYRDENDYWNDDFDKYEGDKKNFKPGSEEEGKKDVEVVQVNCDPLCDSPPPASPSSSDPHYNRVKQFGNSTKKGLTDTDALVAFKLKENNVKTIDIAVMMDISERTVTRLFLKAKGLDVKKSNPNVDKIVEKFLEDQDQYRGVTKPRNKSTTKKRSGVTTRKTAVKEESDEKRETGMRLLTMNVKVSDIVKMLNVSERTVTRWKQKLKEQGENKGGEGHEVFDTMLEVKSEPEDNDEYGEYEMS